MIICYIIMIFFCCISLTFHKYESNTIKNRTKLRLCFFLLVIIRTFIAWKTWPDLPEYVDGFLFLSQKSFNYCTLNGWTVPGLKSEPLWMIYSWFVGHIWSNVHFYLFVTAILTLIGYYKCIVRFLPSHLWLLSILFIIIGPYHQSFFVLRQHMAMGFFFWSLPLLVDKKYVKSFVLILLAAAIHQTAIFVIPVVILFLLQRNERRNYLFIIGYAVFLYSIIMVLGIIASSYLVGYEGYAELLDEDAATNYKSAALLTGILAIRFFVMNKKLFPSREATLLSYILLIGAINAICGTGTTSYMSRLNMYFSDFGFIIIPDTLSYIKNPKNRKVISMAILLFLAYFSFTNLITEFSDGSMYRFF